MNSSTNKIYVSNEGSNNVTVIDGVTNATTTLTDPSAVAPVAVAVDSATNRVYVSNRGIGPGSVTIIDGTTNSFTTVMAPDGATDAAAVNPMTNRIYAGDGSNVTVIDGSGSATSHILIFTLAGSGFGAVSSIPSAINCNGPSCSASFPAGTAATFTAAPASYSTFSGWGAACVGTNPCNLTMDSDHFVTATFAMKPGIDFSLQPASSSLTAERGSQVSDVITVSGSPEAVVQLSCIQSGPIPASCTLSPSSVTLAGGSIAATLTVTIGSQAATLVRARKRHRTFYAGFLPISGLALVGLCLARARSRTQTRLLWLLCSVLFLPGGLSSGCGSGNNGPLRTYTTVIVGNVIGFSGAIEHTTSITVTAP